MIRSYVTADVVRGHTGAVEINNSNVVIPVSLAVNVGSGDIHRRGHLFLSQYDDRVRYTNGNFHVSLSGPLQTLTCLTGINIGAEQEKTLVSSKDIWGATKINPIADAPAGQKPWSTANPDGIRAAVNDPVSKFPCQGLLWHADEGRLEVRDAGVYAVRLSLAVWGGGKGLIMGELVDADDNHIIKCLDTLGGNGADTTYGLGTWSASTHTHAKLSGDYYIKTKFQTNDEIDAWLLTLHVSMLTPIDPNVEFPQV